MSEKLINEPPFTVWADDIPDGISVRMFHDEDDNRMLRFDYEDSYAVVACGYDTKKAEIPKMWATVYWLKQRIEFNKEQAIHLLSALKDHYTKHNYDFAFAFADTALMKHVLYVCDVKERCETEVVGG